MVCVDIPQNIPPFVFLVYLDDVGEDHDSTAGDNKKSSTKSTGSKASKSVGTKDSGTPTGSSSGAAGFSSGGTPSLDARAKFGANLFLLSGSELGRVMTSLELECPRALETWENQKMEINVDEIPPKIFSTLNAYVSSKVGTRSLPDSPEVDDVSNKRKRRKKD